MATVEVIKNGNILEAPTEAIVNPVNCVGVMGKGVALQFRHAFPRMYSQYMQDCIAKRLTLGKVRVYPAEGLYRFIICFPTKWHWREKSELCQIQFGIESLISTIVAEQIKSIAIPALGCGEGGLEWDDVYWSIQNSWLPSIPTLDRILLFEPHGR